MRRAADYFGARSNSARRVIALLAGSVVFSSLVAAPVPAQAFLEWGCKYSGNNPTIRVAFLTSIPSGLQFQVRQAMADWNATSVPGAFTENIAYAKRVDTSAASYADPRWAWVSGGCDAWAGGASKTWYGDQVDMVLNLSQIQGLNGQGKRIVTVHELGHAYGLWHVEMNCAQVPAVMDEGGEAFDCPGTAPWPDDQSGVRWVYR